MTERAVGNTILGVKPRSSPLAELVLELTAPRKQEVAGLPRAAARARVSYIAPGAARGVDGPWMDFVAPLGPAEAGELAWYLESYPEWPFGPFKDRARKLEDNLPRWGRQLFDALPGQADQAQAAREWRDGKGIPAGQPIERRITILVDDRGGDGEAAAMLLALPWELLADDRGYLFEGKLRARVRRKLPSTEAMVAAEPRLPLRVLLVLARPEEPGVSFLDPRASALPLAGAIEDLGEDVELTVLAEGTVRALREALEAGEREGRPYQVVHFDGHGVYDKKTGLGRLCFEDAEDAEKGLLERRADRVGADRLGQLLRDYRIPLFVLEACQSAAAETEPTASVAAELLRAGVASVVAMSHAVLVETGRRFVAAFYEALAEGDRIGTAMVRAQRALKDNSARGEVRGQGRIELHDWLVPVLFQEDADARLVPGGVDLHPESVEGRRQKAKEQRGELPEPPGHGFVGRARAFLEIDRRLGARSWLALLGRGGEGKTALAVEAARWMLAMRRVDRVAFASVEHVGEARAVLDALGRQLVGAGFSVAAEEGIGTEQEKLARAMLPVKRALRERRVLVVVDNMESVLPAPGVPWAPDDEGVGELLGMLKELVETGETRLLLTSREAVQVPLAGRELRVPALGVREARELLAGVLRASSKTPVGGSREDKEEREAVDALIEAVGGHPRSLVLLGALVAERDLEAVAADVRAAMGELEARFPDMRERSLIASVRVSLRRLPAAERQRIRGLGVFHGLARIESVAHVLQMEAEEVVALTKRLVGMGLAEANGLYLTMDPGLGPTLAAELEAEERKKAEIRWLNATVATVDHLYHQQFNDVHASRYGARSMLREMLTALHMIEHEAIKNRAGMASAIDYATKLEQLVSSLGLTRALEHISTTRRHLAEGLPTWIHARFIAEAEEVDRRYEAGDLLDALKRAMILHKSVESAQEVYPEAAYDRTMALLRVGRMLAHNGRATDALKALDEAQRRSAELAAAGIPNAVGVGAAANCDKGIALHKLGRLEEAVTSYEDSIRVSEAIGDQRTAAAARSGIGTVRLNQRRFAEALEAYGEARLFFETIGEPRTEAIMWHQIGSTHAESGNFDAAEHAYRKALVLWIASGSRAGESGTLGQLGTLYQSQDRLEDAVTCYQQSIEMSHNVGDPIGESIGQNNLAVVLHRLGRLDEARAVLRASLTLKKLCGHGSTPWNTWSTLAVVERDAGLPEAAAEARLHAIATYRDFRNNGGHPLDPGTQFIILFSRTLHTSGSDAAQDLLNRHKFAPEFAPTIRALQAIAAGSHDPLLVNNPFMLPTHIVEISLLLETLPPADPAPAHLAAETPCPCGSDLPFSACHGTEPT